MNLGAMLRRQRKGKKLTLKTVAEKAGISEGFLSQVENSVKSPSVDTLMNICAALEVNAGDILNSLENRENLFLIQRSEWEDVDISHTGFATRRFCPPEDRTDLDSAVLFLEPGASIPVRKGVKNVQEVLCPLSGSVELVSGRQKVVLAKGDAVHFWSDPERQSITNTGEERAVVLWVGTL